MKNNIQHKSLANGRWAQMPLCEQMANIGSEVNRALNWRIKNNDSLSKKAINRALELLDLSRASTKSFSCLKELSRLRECIVDYFYYDNQYSSSEDSWRKYFHYFNLAARRGC